MERAAEGERFIRLEAASGSKGLYGVEGTVGDFLLRQGVGPYLDAIERYTGLLAPMRSRVAQLVDFEKTEPGEFRRIAIREALAESGYDHNRLIDALFDSDPHSGFRTDGDRCAKRHITALGMMIDAETDAAQIAAAAALLAVSLGYTLAAPFAAVGGV
jgi:hypothetical protein